MAGYLIHKTILSLLTMISLGSSWRLMKCNTVAVHARKQKSNGRNSELTLSTKDSVIIRYSFVAV